MWFNRILGLNELDENKKVVERHAVRAIIIRDGKLLMIKSNKGDYKLPGGGIELNESHQDALIREVAEETGYQVNEVRKHVGVVIEQKVDEFDHESYFRMISQYYIAGIGNAAAAQTLDDYEQEQQFTAVFIPIQEAIAINEEQLLYHVYGSNPWLEREILVLKAINHHMGQ